MAITTTFVFTNTANYTYSNSTIVVSGGWAALLYEDGPNQNFNNSFQNSSGFTFNTSYTEIAGSKLLQIDQRPADATFYSECNTSVNGNWGDGIVVGSAYGGAAISDEWLDLSGVSGKYINYPALGNADSSLKGTFRFNFRPNYSGNPTNTQFFLSTALADDNGTNLLQYYHFTNGSIYIYAKNYAGVSILQKTFVAWTPSSGTEYEIEFGYDFEGGDHRLFIDGTRLGSIHTETGSRSTIGLFRVGDNVAALENADFSIRKVTVFDTVQHTANYTAGESISNVVYRGDTITMPENNYTGVGNLKEYTDFTTVQSGDVYYTFNNLYWSGSEWVTSVNTYTQANTKAEAASNITTLTGSDTTVVKILTTDVNTFQAQLDLLTLFYTSQIYNTTGQSIVPVSKIAADAINSITTVTSETVNDVIQYNIEVNNISKYWSGSEWTTAVSDYLTTNDLTTVNSYLPELDINIGASIRVVSWLKSDAGSYTPTLDELSISTNFFGSSLDTATPVVVYGYLYDSQNNPLSNVLVNAGLYQNAVYGNQILFNTAATSTFTNSIGYWEMNLIDNAGMSPQTQYMFTFTGNHVSVHELKTIPNTISINYGDL